MILNSISAVLTIFVLIGVGAFASHKKWLDRNIAQSFPKLLINFSIPANVLVTFSKSFAPEELSKTGFQLADPAKGFTAADLEKFGILLLAPFAAVVVMLLLARLAALLFKIPATRRGVFTVLFAFSNSVFIGFPVAQILFGEGGMLYATFYYVAMTVCFWTFGYYGIKRDADKLTGTLRKISVPEILKKVFNIPLAAIAVSVVLLLFNLRLPELVLKPAEFLGALTTPLSMIFIGCVLYDTGITRLKMEKGIAVALIGRFVVSCAVMFGSCTLFGITGLAENVYITQISLPAMSQTVITSDIAGADSGFAAKGVGWTTLLSLFTIPAIVLIFKSILTA